MITGKDYDILHPSSERTETDIAYLSRHNDILLMVIKDDSTVSVDHMKQLLKASVKLMKHEKYYTIIDVRVNAGAGPGVIEYYSENEYNQYRHADAFIINTLAMRLLVNFYMAFKKHHVQTKTFADTKSAAEWIRSVKENKS